MNATRREGLAGAADRLRALHHGQHPLVLANVWDAWSARAVEAAGHRVVATSSAALVAALGHRDGGVAPVDDVFAALARVAGAVSVPVTADIEDGYQMDPDDLVDRLLSAGAVGCNLEDTDHHHSPGSLVDVDRQCERLSAVRRAATDAGVGLVVNARVDVLLRQDGDPDERVERTIERARAYLGAGADCVYPIVRAIDEVTATQLTGRIDGPVNLLAEPTAADVARLAACGARRISVGSGLLLELQRHLGEVLTALGG